MVALLGPNGAGKTTTLMMLLGVTEPDEGTVTLLGHPLPEERTKALEQTNFTASYIGLPYKVRVREILDIFRTLYGARKGRVDELVEAFGLGSFLDRYNSQLSSGQRTLVGLTKSLLSRAAAARPRRADGVARPGGLGARPAGDPGRAREGQLHAARDVPQHGGHRAHVPPRGVHREGQGRRGRLADRDHRAVRNDGHGETFLHLARARLSGVRHDRYRRTSRRAIYGPRGSVGAAEVVPARSGRSTSGTPTSCGTPFPASSTCCSGRRWT